ncbi:hypothetical protein JOC69_003188 [Heliobacterium gestii]|nr:hypothetical protein [Heliomicrobium gestii]
MLLDEKNGSSLFCVGEHLFGENVSTSRRCYTNHLQPGK